MIKRLLIFGSLLLSVIFFYLAFNNFFAETKKDVLTHDDTIGFRYETKNTKVNLEYFNKDYSQDKITAIGVIGTQSCAMCVTEFLEYSDEITSLNDKFFTSSKIDKFFVVIADDSISAKRFKISHDIKERTYQVKIGSKLGDKLYAWEKGKYLSQWIFVENKSSKIISRIPVLNSLTQISYKKNLVQKAVFY